MHFIYPLVRNLMTAYNLQPIHPYRYVAMGNSCYIFQSSTCIFSHLCQ